MPPQEYTILALSLLVGSTAHFERVSWEISTQGILDNFRCIFPYDYMA